MMDKAPDEQPSKPAHASPVDSLLQAEIERLKAQLQACQAQQSVLLNVIPQIIWTADGQGSITYVNQCWFDYTGRDAATSLGQEFFQAIHPQDRAGFVAQWQQALGQWVGYELEFRLGRADGTYRWCTARVNPMWGENNQISGWIGCCSDIDRHKKTEATLEQEQEFLKSLLSNLSDGIVACNAEGVLTLFNQATQDFHGLPPSALPPEEWATHYDLYQADGKTVMQPQEVPLFRALQGETVRNAEMVIAPKHGTTRILLASGNAIVNAEGEKLGAVVAMRDITERKQAEAMLQQRERELQALLDNMPDVVIRCDRDLRYVYVNHVVEQSTGLPASAFIGKTPAELGSPPDLCELWKTTLQHVLTTGEDRVIEFEAPSVTGMRHYQSRVVSEYNSAGEIEYALIFSRDVTDIKQAAAEVYQLNTQLEQRVAERTAQLDEANRLKDELLQRERDARVLAESTEERYRNLVNGLKDVVVWETEPETQKVNFVSQNAEAILGYPLDDWRSGFTNWSNFVHPDDRDWVMQTAADAMAQGQDYELEYRFLSGTGQVLWLRNRVYLVRDEAGQVRKLRGLTFDVTQHKRTGEIQRFLSEASTLLSASLDYQTTLENLAQLMVPHLADWCAVDILEDDQTLQRLAVAHVDPAKVEWGKELHQKYPPDPNQPTGVYNVLRTGQPELYPELPEELLRQAAQDEEHWQLIKQIGFTSALVVPLIARGRTLGAMTLVYAESGLHYDQADLATFQELAHRAAMSVDNARLFRAVQDELVERQRTESALRESEARFRFMANSAPILLWMSGIDTQCTFFNQVWLDFTGRSLEEELGDGWLAGVHPEDISFCLDIYHQAFATRQKFEMEYRLRRFDGEYRWVFNTGIPRFLPNGSFAGYIGCCIDVTERKQAAEALAARAAELAQLNTVLAQTTTVLEKRNQELDQFAYVISHDLKAPLRAIASLSEWMEEDLAEVLTTDTQHQMNLMRGRVHRMESLIDGLLQYSRVGRVETLLSTVNVEDLLRNVIDSLAPPPPFQVIVQPGMPTLSTERLRLEQVFANLIGNAIKHHRGPEGWVKIGVEDRDTMYEFTVADNGPGIAPQYHNKIFVIFQTLEARDKVENTGIGLSLVKKIIEGQGGTISVESQLGHGATFRFTWPKVPPQVR